LNTPSPTGNAHAYPGSTSRSNDTTNAPTGASDRMYARIATALGASRSSSPHAASADAFAPVARTPYRARIGRAIPRTRTSTPPPSGSSTRSTAARVSVAPDSTAAAASSASSASRRTVSASLRIVTARPDGPYSVALVLG
jgi:hypothetical protein